MDNEIEPLGEDLEDNYDRFIVEAIECGCVWGLENDEGWALSDSDSHSDSSVMPFWSQPEYAQAHCVEEWSSYKAVPIALEELLDEWLPGMHSDVILVGVNFNSDMEGIEIEPLDLIAEIEAQAQA